MKSTSRMELRVPTTIWPISTAWCSINCPPASRYGVDMIYFTSDEKRQEMEEKVIYAVSSAISWLDNDANRRSNRDQGVIRHPLPSQPSQHSFRYGPGRPAIGETRTPHFPHAGYGTRISTGCTSPSW